MKSRNVTFENFATVSDAAMIAAARRLVSARPAHRETAQERELRLRPNAKVAGRIVFRELQALRKLARKEAKR